jgi:hypothetical protein
MVDEPPPPSPGYGTPPPAPPWGVPGEVRRTEGSAIGAFVVSLAGVFLVGIFFGGFVAAIAALLMARNAQQKIDASGGRLTGAGFVTAARIIAVVSIVLSVISIVIVTTR